MKKRTKEEQREYMKEYRKKDVTPDEKAVTPAVTPKILVTPKEAEKILPKEISKRCYAGGIVQIGEDEDEYIRAKRVTIKEDEGIVYFADGSFGWRHKSQSIVMMHIHHEETCKKYFGEGGCFAHRFKDGIIAGR